MNVFNVHLEDFWQTHLQNCEKEMCQWCELYDPGVFERMDEEMCGMALQKVYGGLSAKAILKKLNWPIVPTKKFEKRSISRSKELVEKWIENKRLRQETEAV